MLLADILLDIGLVDFGEYSNGFGVRTSRGSIDFIAPCPIPCVPAGVREPSGIGIGLAYAVVGVFGTVCCGVVLGVY